MSYTLRSNRSVEEGRYVDPVGEGYEGQVLSLLGCDRPTCDQGRCACSYKSDLFTVYASASRSFGDVLDSAVSRDLVLVAGALAIMAAYLALNLGGLCHRVRSRSGLAIGCLFTIVCSAFAGYGLGMLAGGVYTPIHSVLPFVIIGVGVDDSFVIVSAVDQTDEALSVPERLAEALSRAGASLVVTSLTSFAAFALSTASALPALSSLCMYASFCVMSLLVLQVTMFAAFVALDMRRVAARHSDCLYACCCFAGGPRLGEPGCTTHSV